MKHILPSSCNQFSRPIHTFHAFRRDIHVICKVMYCCPCAYHQARITDRLKSNAVNWRILWAAVMSDWWIYTVNTCRVAVHTLAASSWLKWNATHEMKYMNIDVNGPYQQLLRYTTSTLHWRTGTHYVEFHSFNNLQLLQERDMRGVCLCGGGRTEGYYLSCTLLPVLLDPISKYFFVISSPTKHFEYEVRNWRNHSQNIGHSLWNMTVKDFAGHFEDGR